MIASHLNAPLTSSDALRIDRLGLDYTPSLPAWRFHTNPARFRFLIWGIKSGKTAAGAREFLRCALSTPGTLNWVVGPTYQHVRVAEREILGLLANYPGIVVRRHRAGHEINLRNGSAIEMHTAEKPNHLRGPNIDGMIWIDEGAYLRPEAWWVLLERVAATRADVVVTTTPRGRNWVYNECVLAGLPVDAPYGEFLDEAGQRFVSHYETSNFPWVTPEDIEEARQRMPEQVFNQEYRALFVSNASQVFPNYHKCISLEPFPETITGVHLMGVDLARYQDWSSVVVMTASGRVLYTDRWSDTAWSVQIARLSELAKDWNAVMVLDRSNVGSKVDEDLRSAGFEIFPVDMNAPQTKMNMVQALQVAFERKQISLPSHRSPWVPNKDKFEQLLRELEWYEYKVTNSGRFMSYSAPPGLSDDMTVALCLANWGRIHGKAGGMAPAEVVVSSEEWGNPNRINMGQDNDTIRMRRPQIFGDVFSRKSKLGFESSGPFWR